MKLRRSATVMRTRASGKEPKLSREWMREIGRRVRDSEDPVRYMLVSEFSRSLVESRLDHSRKLVKTGVQDAIHLTLSARRRNIAMNVIGETEHPNRVALVERYVAKH